jgi:3'-phosphoadenosine 5'-phosphosulfate sulfotransferase (PAPS reductase)/FAD synthetase
MTGRSKILASHLKELEADSIHIFREVVAEAENPTAVFNRQRFRGNFAHRDESFLSG